MSVVATVENEYSPVKRGLGSRTACWREWEFWALAVVALLVYGTRLTAVPIRGEETRRAQVACEMVARRAIGSCRGSRASRC